MQAPTRAHTRLFAASPQAEARGESGALDMSGALERRLKPKEEKKHKKEKKEKKRLRLAAGGGADKPPVSLVLKRPGSAGDS
jgi:hypothetical protein